MLQVEWNIDGVYKMKLPWFKKKKLQIPFEAGLNDNGDEPKIDFNSPTWRYIQKFVTSELQAARESNDTPHHDEVKTANIRGKIRFCKDLLELNNRAGNATGILNTAAFVPVMEKHNE